MVPEYYVSLLNWPIEANSPKEAAKIAYESLKDDPTEFYLTVTSEEGVLVAPSYLPSGSQYGYNPDGFLIKETFDTELFEDEFSRLRELYESEPDQD